MEDKQTGCVYSYIPVIHKYTYTVYTCTYMHAYTLSHVHTKLFSWTSTQPSTWKSSIITPCGMKWCIHTHKKNWNFISSNHVLQTARHYLLSLKGWGAGRETGWGTGRGIGRETGWGTGRGIGWETGWGTGRGTGWGTGWGTGRGTGWRDRPI